MKKYILASDLYDEIEWCDDKPEDTDWLESIIDSLPDPILRCKNCESRDKKNHCMITKLAVNLDDFCSRATPKEIFALKEKVKSSIQRISTDKLIGDWDDKDSDTLTTMKWVYEFLSKIDEEE